MTSDVGYHMCKSKGQHNNLVFLKQKKLQEIKALKTAWASNVKLNLQPDEKSMEVRLFLLNAFLSWCNSLSDNFQIFLSCLPSMVTAVTLFIHSLSS